MHFPVATLQTGRFGSQGGIPSELMHRERKIAKDQARGKSLGVKTAPSLFVDRREMGPNNQNPEGVRRLVDEAVKAKSSTSEKK